MYENIKLTSEEKRILKLLSKKYKYLVRAENNHLLAFSVKPIKDEYRWDSSTSHYVEYIDENLFDFIKWSDNEPYQIEDSLKKEDIITLEELEELKQLNEKGINFITRDRVHNELAIWKYGDKPYKRSDYYWSSAHGVNGWSPIKLETENSFDFIKFEDDKPLVINEVLKENNIKREKGVQFSIKLNVDNKLDDVLNNELLSKGCKIVGIIELPRKTEYSPRITTIILEYLY